MSALDPLCPQPFDALDSAARAAYLAGLADCELCVALLRDAEDDRAELRLFTLEQGPVALVTDSDERLAAFLGAAVPYAAMPGRALAALLAEQGIAALVNPGAPSEALLDPATLGWLVAQISEALPETAPGERPARLLAPDSTAVAQWSAPLQARMALLGEHLTALALVGAQWPDGREGHLIVVQGAAPDDHPALAKALAEMIAFAPEEAVPLDLVFDLAPLPDGALILAAPPPDPGDQKAPKQPKAPGSDPARPPILRF